MAMLHVVNKSPYERNALASCLRLATDGATVLLIEDAVVAATAGTEVAQQLTTAADRITVCVLGPDLAARGLTTERVPDGVAVVDYTEFVALACDHDSVQSWL